MKSSRKTARGHKQKPPDNRRKGATRAQAKIIELFGTIPFDPTYDYKVERKKDQIR